MSVINGKRSSKDVSDAQFLLSEYFAISPSFALFESDPLTQPSFDEKT